MDWIENGGITAPLGFLAAGIASGIKSGNKKDLALIVSERDAKVGTAYTSNLIKAAPVKISMQHNRRSKVKGVVINSGNANCATGIRGIRDAQRMVDKTASAIGCKHNQVLVCSTGKIGEYLPIMKIMKGITKAAKKLSGTSGRAAARAIMTTDTFTKESAATVDISGAQVTIGAMAKGAGMIHPDMATMLAFVTTDACIDAKVLQSLTTRCVTNTFNRISVDGDTSTNDTVLVLANGMAENALINEDHPDLQKFEEALYTIMSSLAKMIVLDGESISHVVHLKVHGAVDHVDAKRVAEAIARSPLVRSSWAGNDPNWGRVMDVVGYSGARVEEETLDIFYDGLNAVRGGVATRVPLSRLKAVAAKKEYSLCIDLHLGEGEYELFVNDLTPGYVKFNMGE
ncbi:MAG: bifunctional glutamate N-acetyltransferase/amino-acid acetyltransferase ArgJ [Verrucomicrobiota bacterium]